MGCLFFEKAYLGSLILKPELKMPILERMPNPRIEPHNGP